MTQTIIDIYSLTDNPLMVINITGEDLNEIKKCAANHAAKQIVECLDHENTIKLKSLANTQEACAHCGLLLPETKWQEIRQALKELVKEK